MARQKLKSPQSMGGYDPTMPTKLMNWDASLRVTHLLSSIRTTPRRRISQVLAFLAILLWGIFVAVTLRDINVFGERYSMVDFLESIDAGQALLSGTSPYLDSARQNSPFPFLNPPIFAILVLPLSFLAIPIAKLTWYGLSLAFLAVGFVGAIDIAGPSGPFPDRRTALASLAVLAFLYYPIWTNFKLGQSASLIFCLVAGALCLQSRDRPVAGGIALGVAIALKLTPILLVAYALWVGWRRFSFAAIATFIALQLISAVRYPSLFADYWVRVFPSITPSDSAINLAVTNLVLQLEPSRAAFLYPAAIVLSALVLVLPFALAGITGTHDRKDLLSLFGLLIIATAIAGPLVENHYMVWLLVPIWHLIATLVRRRDQRGLAIFALIFVLLSQPFRIARLFAAFTALPTMSPDAANLLGGSVLEVGVILLYSLYLVTIVRPIGYIQTRQEIASGPIVDARRS